MNDVCGMFHFIAIDYPDQFYRLFTSLLLHAGLIHLIISVAFQHLLLADLERLIGPMRTAILYIGSGIAGNLTSAIFVPYKAEVSVSLQLTHRPKGSDGDVTFLLYRSGWTSAFDCGRAGVIDAAARTVPLEELEETTHSYDQIAYPRLYPVRAGDTATAAELYRADRGPADRYSPHASICTICERNET